MPLSKNQIPTDLIGYFDQVPTEVGVEVHNFHPT